MNTIGYAAAVAILVFSASGLAQQPVYKSTMPGGKVIYGDKPQPGAVQVEAITPKPATTVPPLVTPSEKAAVESRIENRARSEEAAQGRVEAARRNLAAAETAREEGKEPLEGERRGTAGGGSRLTEAYFDRQKKLEQAVEDARKALEEAQREARSQR